MSLSLQNILNYKQTVTVLIIFLPEWYKRNIDNMTGESFRSFVAKLGKIDHGLVSFHVFSFQLSLERAQTDKRWCSEDFNQHVREQEETKKKQRRLHCQNTRHDIHVDKLGLVCLVSFTVSLTFQLNLHVIGGMELKFLQTEWPNINQPECIIITLRQNATTLRSPTLKLI
jgi:hypothetical protein